MIFEAVSSLLLLQLHTLKAHVLMWAPVTSTGEVVAADQQIIDCSEDEEEEDALV